MRKKKDIKRGINETKQNELNARKRKKKKLVEKKITMCEHSNKSQSNPIPL